MDHGLAHREPGPRGPAADRQGPRPAARRDQRPALHRRGGRARARGAALCAVRQDPGRPEPVPARGPRLLPQVAAEMRAIWVDKHGLPEACDNTLLIAERCSTELRRELLVHAAFPRARRGRPSSPGSSREVERGLDRPVPRRDAARGPQAGRLRGRRHHPDELPRLLPGGRRLHQLGQGQRHPGRSRPRLRRRVDGRLRDADHRPEPPGARADLRAVPEPRPGVHARLRRGLRRAPARRRDPVRHRQVRRRPGRADRHLRHDQGQAGGQGRRQGARHAVLGERPDHQGDAAAGDGQGPGAGQDLRPGRPPVQRGR